MSYDGLVSYRTQANTNALNNLLRGVKMNTALHSLPLPPGPFRQALQDLRMGELTILGGFEGHGKSALAEQIAGRTSEYLSLYNKVARKEQGQKQKAVLYFTLEMSAVHVMCRILAQNSEVLFSKLIDPEHQPDEFFDEVAIAEKPLQDWPIYFCDKAVLSFSDIADKIHLLEHEGDGLEVKLVVVDYLQLMDERASDGNEVTKLDNLVRDLKELARQKNMHVIALSSLNRIDTGVMPSSTNIRGSGGISYAADNVVILHNPRISDGTLDDSWKDVAMFRVAKQRNGPVGTYYMRWHPTNLRFTELSEWDRHRLSPLVARNRRGYG